MSYWFQALRFDNRSAFDMEWSCTKISNKISRSLRIMCKLKRFLPPHILRILYNSLIHPHLQCCVLSWGFQSDRIFKLQKELFELLHAVCIMPIRKAFLKTPNLLKLSISWKQKHWNDIVDTNEINFQNICNQCSLNQMIIIHMILHISLFYINYQQRQALGGYV